MAADFLLEQSSQCGLQGRTSGATLVLLTIVARLSIMYNEA